jgi:hypothetical protein
MWIEKIRRQAFSEAVVSDHDESWLVERLTEPVPMPNFGSIFDTSLATRSRIVKVSCRKLGMSVILPIVREGIFRRGQLISD